MNHDPELLRRPAESALFGVQIASAVVNTADDVRPLLEAATSSDVRLVVLRVSAHRQSAIHAIEAFGGKLCDVLVTLERSAPVGGFEDVEMSDDFALGLARATDSVDLCALASRSFAGSSGHWHADASLRDEDADELYGRWASDLVTSSNDETQVLVARDNAGALAAFLAIVRHNDRRWNVALTAVLPQFRSQKLLRRLLVAASRIVALRNEAVIAYETQVTNIPAIRAVSALGFRQTSARMTFHLWMTP